MLGILRYDVKIGNIKNVKIGTYNEGFYGYISYI